MPVTRSSLRVHWPLYLILTLFLILGTLYSVVSPLFEKPDELRHYAYVKYLADGRGLPLFAAEAQPLWRQEATQGPLFYALAATATFWIDDGDLDQLIPENPHYLGGQGAWGDNVNRYVHTDREAFPYRGAALAVHAARLVALAMGAITVAATYAIARTAFPARPALAAGGAALVAFNPMFLFISSSASNDSTVAAAAALTFLAAIKTSFAAPPQTRHFLALGLALGLTALAKSSGLALAPVAGLALIAAGVREKSWGPFIRGTIIVGLAFLLLSGWWFAANWAVNGDPLGTVTHAARFGRRTPTPTMLQLVPELEGLEESFWALFGWRNLPADGWLYTLLAVLDRLALVGWGLLLIRRVWCRTWSRREGIAAALLWLWFGLILITVLRWMQLSSWGNIGRLLFPGIGAVALLLILGWSGFVPRNQTRTLVGALAGGFLILAAASPLAYIAPAYARPAPLAESDLRRITHRLDETFGGKIALLGYDLSAAQVRPGEELLVTLYWRALDNVTRDYSVVVHLLDQNDVIVAQRDSHPAQGRFPTSRWAPGQAIADLYRLALPLTAYAPAQARLEVGLYHHATGQRLLTGAGTDNARFGQVAIAPNPGDLPNPVRFNFGDKIALLGYSFDRRAAPPGETLTLTLHWEALAEMDENYAAFVQVKDETEIWARRDAWPQDGDAPTAAWEVSRRVIDLHPLTLDPNTPPGVYDVEIGLYLSGTPKRLRLLADDGFPLDTRLVLSKIRVTSQSTPENPESE
jgi:4-amino-4-deoxy-L-arabinose transferase-like glycosyltransferase